MKIGLEKQSRLGLSEARSLLRYDSDTGKLYWLVDRKRRKAGDIAGSIAPTTGRPVITINKVNYLQHRIAWLLHYGAWPERLVDHVNGDITDNRIVNLRLADPAQNAGNRGAGRNRTEGSLKGASISRRPGRATVWRASIKRNGKTKNLGSFTTEEAAHEAYCRAAKVAFGEFHRPN